MVLRVRERRHRERFGEKRNERKKILKGSSGKR